MRDRLQFIHVRFALLLRFVKFVMFRFSKMVKFTGRLQLKTVMGSLLMVSVLSLTTHLLPVSRFLVSTHCSLIRLTGTGQPCTTCLVSHTCAIGNIASGAFVFTASTCSASRVIPPFRYSIRQSFWYVVTNALFLILAIGRFCFVSGSLRVTKLHLGTTLFRLPKFCRPHAQMVYSVLVDRANSVRLDIFPSGIVK